MKRLSLLICAAFVFVPPATLSAQSSVVRARTFAVCPAAVGSIQVDWAQDSSQYRPRAWKTGALIGAGVGILAGTIALTSCDPDANDDCPGWGRVGRGVLVVTGLGTLIGGLFPR